MFFGLFCMVELFMCYGMFHPAGLNEEVAFTVLDHHLSES
jgi:hypothetical protein